MVASLRVKLKKVSKAKLNKQWNLDKVKDALCATDYRCEVDSHIEKASQEHKDLETRWQTFRIILLSRKPPQKRLGIKIGQESESRGLR